MSFGDGGELWNEAKSTPYGYDAGASAGFPLIIDPATLSIPTIPTIPAQLVQAGSGVGAGSVEYDGTTYYVSPEEFQRRILPEIMERRRKAAKRHLSMREVASRTSNTEESMIAGTSSASPQPLEITRPVGLGTRHCLNPEAKDYQPTQHTLEERGFLSFQAQPYSQWKFYEGLAQQGKPMMVVNFRPMPDSIGGTTSTEIMHL